MTYNPKNKSQKPEFQNPEHKNPEDEINTEVAMPKEQLKPSSSKEFFGSPSSVEHALEKFQNEKPWQTHPITEISIVVMGDQTKPANQKCLCLTIICGCLLCLPWLFCCCGWWKKIVWPRMEVPLGFYNKLEIIKKIPTLKQVTLMVTDNKLGKAKADSIYKALSGSTVQNFTLMNLASETDWDQKEHTRFNHNMRQIKQMRNIRSDIRWNSKSALEGI